MNSRNKSNLRDAAHTKLLLNKIKTLYENKANSLKIRIGRDLLKGENLDNLDIDADASDDNLTFQRPYIDPVAASKAIQDLTYTAAVPGPDGNDITVEYEDWTPAVAASLLLGGANGVLFEAVEAGADGNLISIQYTATGTAGAEGVSVLANAITVDMEPGASTAENIADAVNGYPAAAALVTATENGTPSAFQTGPVAATFLEDGEDAHGEAGDEEVTVVGTAITVKLQSGVSTATQVKAAIDAEEDATDLVSVAITGTASDAQVTAAAANLADGFDAGDFKEAEVYNTSDITFIKRLRSRKWLIVIGPDADPAEETP